MFSATQTKQLEALVRAGLRNPVVVCVKEKFGSTISTPVSLSNFYLICEADRKLRTLIGFIESFGKNKKFIIFFSTCASVEWFYIVLKTILFNYKVSSLHGKMGKKRHRILETFRCTNSGLLLCTDVMARGIDIPEVDWVIQFDPPTRSASFVHRVGRTARNGLPGSSLLMLLPSEDLYVEFIKKNQKVDLKEKKVNWKVPEVLEKVHQLQLQDRANFDRANRAFVSFVQSYAKHECSLILRVKNIPFGKLATGYGLLKLPKMPELNNKKVEDFRPLEIDFNNIQYLDTLREQSRQKKLKIFMETNSWPTKKNKRRQIQTTPWELSKEKKNEKKKKKAVKRKIGGDKVSGKKKKIKISPEEIESLAKDVALIKKLKSKKISEGDFEREFCS